MFAWLSPGCQCFYTSPRSLPSPCTLGAIAPTLVRLLPQLHNLFIHFHKMLWLFNEVPSYRCAKCCVVIWTNKQINKQQSLPFSLYIVRVISPILSEKKKVETLRSLHCGCFYTHTHKETNMCRECYFVLWRFEPSQPQRIYIRAGNKNQCISHFCSAQQSSNRKILFKNPHILSRHKYKTKQVCTQTSNINFRGKKKLSVRYRP